MATVEIIAKRQRMWVVILKGKSGGIVHGSIADTKRHAISRFLDGTEKPWAHWSGKNGSYEAVPVWCSFNISK